MKLREKLKNWLFKDELLALNDAISKYEQACDEHKKANVAAKIAKADLDAAQKLIEQLMDVGVDVGFKSDEHSWAVICIQGHPEYVKFMPLAHQDVYHVMQFLKQFQYSNRVVDSPFGYKKLIKDYIFENKR